MAKLAGSVDALAAALPDTDPVKPRLRARAVTLGQECGCAMSGAFFAGAALLAAGHFVFFGSLTPGSAATAVGLVFAAAAAGKVAGVAVSRLRLLALRRTIARRLASNGGRHVHLH
ncbi:hypothetical protein [Reyranella sp.]|uniref:hypothetical protein n=1 Tax=Reyranella sp. TaxID=1929291 RepID=UPI003BA9A439